MGIKEKLQKKTMGKMSQKLNKSMPIFIKFAVQNDPGYESLINTIKNINKQRSAIGKKIYEISGYEEPV